MVSLGKSALNSRFLIPDRLVDIADRTIALAFAALFRRQFFDNIGSCFNKTGMCFFHRKVADYCVRQAIADTFPVGLASR